MQAMPGSRSASLGFPAAADPIPLLLVVQPMNIELDDEWEYLVIQQPRRIGAKHAAELAETRTRSWLGAGRAGVRPWSCVRRPHPPRRLALVDEPNKKVVGGSGRNPWSSPALRADTRSTGPLAASSRWHARGRYRIPREEHLRLTAHPY